MHYRAALGQVAALGSLYNARSDEFFTNIQVPDDCIIWNAIDEVSTTVMYEDTYEERFRMLGIQPELGLGLLSGVVRVVGGSSFVLEDLAGSEEGTLWAAIHHCIKTRDGKLKINSASFHQWFHKLHPQDTATHIVIGIIWGVQTVVTAKQDIVQQEAQEHASLFKANMEQIKSSVESQSTSGQGPLSLHNHGPHLSTRVSVYSDLFAGVHAMTNYDKALQYLHIIPVEVKTRYGGKGVPIAYTLLPLEVFAQLTGLPASVRPMDKASGLPKTVLDGFVHFFDSVCVALKQAERHVAFITRHRVFVADRVAEVVQKRRGDLHKMHGDVLQKLERLLSRARDNDISDSLTRLRNAAEESENLKYSDEIGAFITALETKISVIGFATGNGVLYTRGSGTDLDSALQRHRKNNTLVMYFGTSQIQDSNVWQQNHSRFLSIMQERQEDQVLVLTDVDFDGAEQDAKGARISLYRNGEELKRDLCAETRFLADKCLARAKKGTMQSDNIQRPIRRRFVKMPCPKAHCRHDEVCEWLCYQCHAPLEYGIKDGFIYCECGRSHCRNYEFRCSSARHGSKWSKLGGRRILKLLGEPATSDYINILVLGETGVGKSTFINAFVNYLTFDSLDDALEEDLHYVVPCSFPVQMEDENSKQGEFKEFEIKVGSRDDENDGSKGDSATQKTEVYPITIGAQTIRLIDTPGIGDTRGLAHDKKNMADILRTLSGYENLHGILILLKSNNARLTVTFNFCLKELLTHLHRSTSENMVFGFTNTRISNHTPGDTYGPLKRLLADHSDVGLSLNRSTVYCFDSESFRYLAACKNGVMLPNTDDFRRSWDKSSAEARRLIDHFRETKPHVIHSTISLNGARNLISELTKPMAEISQLIQTNIAMCEDKKIELANTRLSGDDLRSRLDVQKIQFRTVPLDHPRTVCAHQDCTEVKDDGTGSNKVVTVYRMHCHERCYLQNVPVDTIAHPDLIGCQAFYPNTTCQHRECQHSWQNHMHIMYELEEYTTMVTDTAVKRQLKEHANDVTLRQTAIDEYNMRIGEYQDEHQQIREASARFSLFLKKNSITPINDATLGYLDMLINQEEAKIDQAEAAHIDASGNKRRLESLRVDREQHIELKTILAQNLESNVQGCELLDEAGVDRLVQSLFELNHFGDNLKSVKNAIVATHQETYRERPFRVQKLAIRNYSHSPAPGTNHLQPDSTVNSPRNRSGTGTTSKSRRFWSKFLTPMAM